MTDTTDKTHKTHKTEHPTEPVPFQPVTERLSHWADDEQKPGRIASLLRLGALVGALGLLGLASWGALFVVLALVVMIFLHELGHYVTAKRSGMKVTEFFIGFGPRIWSFRRGETEYGVKAVWVGAYVKIVGMHNLEDVPPEDEHRTYRQKSYPKRMAVALAGSTMHFLLALVLIYITLVAYGTRSGSLLSEPNEARWEVAELSRPKDAKEGQSPAELAGIQLGDKIVAIDGIHVGTFEELRKEIQKRPGETVTLEVERDGRLIETTTILAEANPESGEKVGFLGVGAGPTSEDVGPLEAIPRSFGELGSLSVRTVGFLGEFFSPSGISNFADQVMGRQPATDTGQDGVTPTTEPPGRPSSIIGVVRFAGEAAKFGFVNLLLILIAVNVFVGIFNLIPLLPFDGGHAAIATYERIRSRPGRRYYVDVAKLMPITYFVVFALGMLFLTTTYLDIFHFPAN